MMSSCGIICGISGAKGGGGVGRGRVAVGVDLVVAVLHGNLGYDAIEMFQTGSVCRQTFTIVCR